jgi:PKD repeat protein
MFKDHSKIKLVFRMHYHVVILICFLWGGFSTVHGQTNCNKFKDSVQILDTAVCIGQTLNIVNLTEDSLERSVSHRWEYTGGSSNDSIPSISFSNGGNYTVRYKGENSDGCKIERNLAIVVVAYYAKITFGEIAQCLKGNEFVFADSSLSYPVNYRSASREWELMGTNISTDSVLNYTFSEDEKDATLTLSSTSTLGCKADTSFTISALPMPFIKFSVNDTAFCFDGINTTEFEATEDNIDIASTKSHSVTIASFRWELNGQSTLNQNTFTIAPDSAGLYSFMLIVETSQGCEDTAYGSVRYFPKPVGTFSINQATQCENNNLFIFKTNNSIAANGGTLTSEWDFGDGNTGIGDSVSHNYVGTIGTKTVKLTVTSSKGCIADVVEKDVDILEGPKALFKIATKSHCLDDNTFRFSDSGSASSSGIDKFIWYYGDGNNTTLNDTLSVVHSYTTAGDYNVKLKVEDVNGCVDSMVKNISVYYNPLAAFTVNDSTQCNSTHEFAFIQSSKSNVGDTTLSYSWNFGDFLADSAQPKITYTSIGERNISLEVGNIYGCKDTQTMKLRVYGMPDVDFAINNDVQCEDKNEFEFTNQTTITSGEGTLAYVWIFGNGETSADENPKHSYGQFDTLNVKLITTTSFGCKDSASKTVEILQKPKALFTVNDTNQCLVNHKFVFTNESESGHNNPILVYNWLFDDGTSDNIGSPEKIYTGAGRRTVSLIATNNAGCGDTFRMVITTSPNPNVSFTINKFDQCRNENMFDITNGTTLSLASDISYDWRFPDGFQTATTDVSRAIYLAAGDHDIKLVATSAFGCKDSFQKTITLFEKPSALITNLRVDTCLNSEWRFKVEDLDAATIDAITWNFPTTNNSTDSFVNHFFQSNGSNTLSAIIQNADGCKDTATMEVKIYRNPISSFTINDSTQCYNEQLFRLTNQTQNFGSSIVFSWNFGDSTLGSSRNPVKIYDYEGYKLITLIATDNFGCADTFTSEVFVVPHPVADFDINNVAQCENDNLFVYESTSTVAAGAGTLNSSWNFGNGTSGTGDLVDINYNNVTGLIRVLHTSTSSYGCKDTQEKTITVIKGPKAGYAIDTVLYCIRGNEFGFTDASVGGVGTVNTYVWTWGDGNVQTEASGSRITHSYGSVSSYDIKLWVKDDQGCYDSITKSTTVHPNPTAKFTIVDSLQCFDANTFNFVQWSESNTGNSALTYKWNFVDTSSTAATPEIVYSSFGSRDITLEASNVFGCKDTFASTLRVYSLPQVMFTVNDSTQCENDHEFSFVNGSSISSGEGSLSYVWDMGDGSFATSADVSHVYGGYDTLQAKLVVSSSFGCKDSMSKRIEVLQKPAIAVERTFSDSCVNSKVSFRAKDLEVSHPFSSSWLFSNGHTSTDSLVTTTYSSEGTKSLRLIVGNARGCLDTIESYEFNLYENPSVWFKVVDTAICYRGNEFEFEDSSTAKYGTALRYVWQFGDGNSDTGTINNEVKHIYADTGFYTVSLQYTNTLGCADTAYRKVRVDYHPVTQITKVNADSCLNSQWSFRVKDALRPSMSSVAWEFPGSVTYANDEVSHIFSTSGSNSIRVEIENSFGCKDTQIFAVNTYTNPVANFTINDSTQCYAVHRFNFTNTSTSPQTLKYVWDFGDTTGSTATNTFKIYSSVGRRDVSLSATDLRGCSDTIVQEVYVAPYPVSIFTIPNASQCENHNLFVFEDASTILLGGGTLRSEWIYGDGGTASGDTVSHNYSTVTGNVTVTHKSISQYGCRDSSTQSITVIKGPKAGYAIDTVLYCIRGNEFGFTDASVGGVGTVNTYVWTWGDGNVQTEASGSRITHSYGSVSSYDIKLWVKDDQGCYDSITKSTTVHPNPTAKFTIVDSLQCFDANTFNFVQWSESNTGNSALTYKWNFVDTSSTAATPEIVYSSFGSRDITLEASNVFGCKDTFASTLRVYSLPQVMFTVNDSTQCENDHEFSFVNGSSISSGEGSLSYVWDMGDGSFATSADVSHVYGGYDTLQAKLVVSSSFGCKDSMSKRIEVLQKPAIAVERTFSDSCVNSKVSFRAKDLEVSHPFSSSWLFSNGHTSTDSLVTTTYSSEGTKSLRLIVGNARGCLDTIESYEFNLYENPSVWFKVVDTAICYRGNEFEFEDSSTAKYGTALRYVWQFGDGNSDTGTINNEVKHIYADTGFYTVSLQYTNTLGCADTAYRKVRVDYHPVTQITKVNVDSCLNNNHSFRVRDDLANTMNAVSWIFDDTREFDDSLITLGFIGDGKRNLQTIIENVFGCKDTAEFEFDLYDNPVASFTIKDTFLCLKGNVFEFTTTSTTAFGTITSNQWDFNTATKTGDNVTHSYTDSGFYKVTLRVNNSLGCADSIDRLVRVSPNPRAYFNPDIFLQCLNDNVTNFRDSSESNTDDLSLTYAWDFGDSTQSVLEDPTKSYQYFGIKTITEIVTNALGCSDTVTRTIEIKPEPIAKFKVNNAEQCLNINSFTFTDTTITRTRGGDHYASWYVDDVFEEDSITDFVTQLPSAKAYNIKLIATSEFGCQDSIEKPVRVLENPIAKISYVAVDSCLSTTSLFKAVNDANNGIRTARWLFSDSTTALGVNVSKKYSNTGLKWVELILENTKGCFDTTRFEFNIHPNPTAKFTPSNYLQCLAYNRFTFSDSSIANTGTIDSIRWRFGDNTVLTQTTKVAQHTYTVATSYRVWVTAFNSMSCQDSTSLVINVRANPTADFDINNATQCLNTNEYVLTNNSLQNNGNATMSFKWSFGDSSYSTARNINKSYATDGSKSIMLIASNNDGCIDTIIKSVTVRPLPVAAFSINNANQCVNQNSFNFSDNSTIKPGGGTLSRTWSLGDGTVSNQTNVNNKVYTTAQTFNIRLISRSQFGCADTLTKNIVLLPKPNVNFTVNQDSQCLVANNYSFSNQSSIVSGGGTLSYQWVYGDGNTSNATHSSHVYGSHGTYRATLKVSSQYGCVDSAFRNLKVVANPSVAFSFTNAQSQCNSVDTFRISNTTNAVNGFGLTYTWRLGDGTQLTSKDVVKSYTQAGSYPIALIARNTAGCQDSFKSNLTVYADPITDFSINASGQCLKTQNFIFTNNSSINYGNGSLSYVWLYRDTVFSNSQNSNTSFNHIGTYPIKLIATSSFGCKDSTVKNVITYPHPVAKFEINNKQQCLTNNDFKFTNNATISTGTLTYSWDFGDSTGNTQISPSRSYLSYGDYKITLVAISNQGCKDTTLDHVKVHSQPLVRFTRSDTALCRFDNKFTFTNQSNNQDASALKYRWTYSDGNQDTTVNVTRGFKESGFYTVKLFAESGFGCKDSLIQTVRVYPQPSPSFVLKKADQCLTNNSYEIVNSSSVASEGGTLSYRWFYGNGDSSIAENPKWNYSKADTFNVRLYVKSSLGCIDSIFKPAVVFPQPSVSFVVNDTSQCLKSNVFEFTNGSTVSSGALTYQWSFGDGAGSVGTSPRARYNTSGSYRVGLFTKTDFGCSDSMFQMVYVNPDPQALFSVNDLTQCLRRNSFSFTNNTLLASGTYSTLWNLGDASSLITTKDASYAYAHDGFYVARMKVTSDKGCIDSAFSILQVYPQPFADFKINDSVQCLNDNDFIFENESKIAYGGLQYFWNYGDVSFGNQVIGRKTYSQAGVKTVQMVATSAFGCSDTVRYDVRITEIPNIAFHFDTTNLCERGNVFNANNNSTYNGTENVNYDWYSTDGYRVNALNFTHSFPAAGRFNVKLVGETTEGCKDSLTKSITVHPQGKSEIVIIDTIQCLLGNDFTFGNESFVNGSVFSLMSWNFGGVLVDTQYRVAPNQFQFGDTGTFKVELISTTEFLCSDTSYGMVRVVPMPVAEMVTGDISLCHNEQEFQYIDISDKKDGYTNEWLFNRQIIQNNDTLEPRFELPGRYSITLVVKSDFGCTDSIRSVAVSNQTPKARIAVNNNLQCFEVNDFIFSNVSTNFTVPTTLWDLGDGTFGSGNTINHVYDEAGIYTILLVVENDSACTDTAELEITVHPTPEATLEVDPSCLNVPIQLESNAYIAGGTIVNYLWNMGDGSNYSDSLPTHSYNKTGKHYITLSMRSDKNCFAKFRDSIEVFENPNAGISVMTERTTILQNEMVFADSSENVASLEWDFGDGSDLVYDEFEYAHVYQDTGDYRVRLVVTSADGCLDTTYRTVRVWPDFNILLPTAFSPNEDQVNDTYRIRGNHHSIKSVFWNVYTEDGIKVYESKNIEDSWNGKYMNTGNELPVGNYLINIVIQDIYGNQQQFNEKIAIFR